MGKRKRNDNTGTRDPYAMTGTMKIGWSCRGISLAANVIILGYLSKYCTSMLGISALTVGTILLVSKIFDSATDIIIGFLIERTNTRWGKARPYELGILGVWLFTIALYSCPDMGDVGKILWIFFMYTFVNSVFATMLNSNESVYIARAFRYESDRNRLVSFNGVAIMCFSILLSIVFPILMGTMATSRAGWRNLILIFAIPLMAIGIMRFLTVKEINPDISSTSEKVTIKEFITAIFRTPYLLVIAGILVLYQIIAQTGTTVGSYYFEDYLGDISLMSTVSIVSIVAIPLIAMLPIFTSRFGKAGTIRISVLIAAFGSGLRYFAGTSIPLLMITSAIAAVSTATTSYLYPLMTIDVMDYSEWKYGGKRIEAAFSCVSSFSIKIGQGLGSFLAGALIDASGYISYEDGMSVVQPDSAISMIRILYSFFPAILLVLMAVVTLLWKLDPQMPQIREELRVRRNAAQ